MASQLGFSEIEFSKNNNQNKTSGARRRRNKTIKKKTEKSDKVKDFLNSLEGFEAMESMDDNTEGLANFEPLEPAKLSKQPAPVKEGFVDPQITQEAYETMDESNLGMNNIIINLFHIINKPQIMLTYMVQKMN